MIQWERVKYFKEQEFPEEDNLNLVEPALIYTLDKFREFLGSKIHPSPEPGALVRSWGSTKSRHYAIGRKSDAVDVFPSCDVRKAFIAAMSFRRWGGVGVYFDTHYDGFPKPMLHLDLRPGAVQVWYRINNKYYLPLRDYSDMHRFFNLMKSSI